VHRRIDRLEVGQQADLGVAGFETRDRVGEGGDPAMELVQLGGELAVFLFQALGMGEVDRAPDRRVPEQHGQQHGGNRQAPDQLERSVRDLENSRGARPLRDDNDGPATFGHACHLRNTLSAADCRDVMGRRRTVIGGPLWEAGGILWPRIRPLSSRNRIV
jgi:hypothetical protein